MRRMTLCILAVLVAGCVSLGGQSPLTQYYILESSLRESTTAAVDTVETGPAIGIRPVEVPGHLDRPEIVTRSGKSRVSVADFDRWAEPLARAIPRVLAENLTVIVPSDRVVVFPWKRATSVDYEVDVRIHEFSRQPDGDVVLIARWTLQDNKKSRRTAHLSTIREPADENYNVIVTAMGDALEALAREIAKKIRPVP